MNKIDQIEALKQRTKDFTLRIIRLFQALPKTEEARIIGKQLLLLLQIIGQHAGQGRTLNFLVRFQ
ncbi:hypothetical protein [Amniculibacterium sp. G2-70]|uniref:hypothetical protein n=1 Tax=Amniculibacterium sp. G2-70 TaxID=2767188 RepID=UPI0021CC946A|nr:hypothetical protein [Amniculibacterium sp. G2-70]